MATCHEDLHHEEPFSEAMFCCYASCAFLSSMLVHQPRLLQANCYWTKVFPLVLYKGRFSTNDCHLHCGQREMRTGRPLRGCVLPTPESPDKQGFTISEGIFSDSKHALLDEFNWSLLTFRYKQEMIQCKIDIKIELIAISTCQPASILNKILTKDTQIIWYTYIYIFFSSYFFTIKIS